MIVYIMLSCRFYLHTVIWVQLKQRHFIITHTEAEIRHYYHVRMQNFSFLMQYIVSCEIWHAQSSFDLLIAHHIMCVCQFRVFFFFLNGNVLDAAQMRFLSEYLIDSWIVWFWRTHHEWNLLLCADVTLCLSLFSSLSLVCFSFCRRLSFSLPDRTGRHRYYWILPAIRGAPPQDQHS